MKKTGEEIFALRKEHGNWVAVIYNRLCGYWRDITFMWYSKKEAIYKLRHEYGFKVGREFC